MKLKDKMLCTIQKELEETKVSVKRISDVQKELEETKNKALKVKMKRIHPLSYLVALFSFLSKMWTGSYDNDTVNCKEVNGWSSCTLTPPQPTPATRGQTTRGQTTRGQTTPATRGQTLDLLLASPITSPIIIRDILKFKKTSTNSISHFWEKCKNAKK